MDSRTYVADSVKIGTHVTDLKPLGNVVLEGGKLIIDGGTLSNVDLLLKAGASLQIINDGIIVTRNGFEAPIGVKVEIINGKIL